MNIKKQKSGDNSTNIQADNLEINFDTHIHNTFNSINESTDSNKKNIIALIRQNKTEEAEIEIDRIKNSQDLDYAKGLIEIGDLYSLVNQEKAEKSYNKAIEHAPNNPKLINVLALFLVKFGRYDDAILLFNRALSYVNDNEIKGGLLGNIGVVYKNKGKLKEAIELIEDASKLSSYNGNEITTIKNLNNLGSCYTNEGDLFNAERKLSEALDLTKQFSENLTDSTERKELKSVKANILTNQAIRYRHEFLKSKNKQHLDKAINCLEIAIEIDDLLGNKDILGRHYGNLANIYRLQGNNVESRKKVKKALSYFKEAGSVKDEITSIMNLGVSYYDEGNFSKAIIYYNDCIDRDLEGNFPRLKAQTFECLAYAFQGLGKNKEMLDNAQKSYQHYTELHLKDLAKHIYNEFLLMDTSCAINPL